MNEHEFELTEEGKREVQSFITECKTKRNEVLDNAGDTIKHTTIPTQKEILNDLNSQAVSYTHLTLPTNREV